MGDVSGESISCTECDKQILADRTSIKKLRKIFCSDCWIHYFNIRFRKRIYELGKPTKGSTLNLLLAPTETVLVVYDGSPSSVALLNLCRDAIISSSTTNDTLPQKHLPFPFNFTCLVILESGEIGGPGVETREIKHMKELRKWLQNTETNFNIHIPLYVSSIEQSFNNCTHTKNRIKQVEFNVIPGNNSEELEEPVGIVSDKVLLDDLTLPFNESLNSQLCEVLRNLQTKTSQKDLLNIIRNNLIVQAALDLHVQKVLLPEDQTALAINMFTTMSLGRGGQLAELMGFTTSIRAASAAGRALTVARPLMDFASDDLRQYLNCLPQERCEGLFNRSAGKSRKVKIDSLERQCDNFIVELQNGFASTVPTLAKIGEKLRPSVSDSASPRRQCMLCNRLGEESDQDDLCYGCSNISRDMKEPELLRKLLEIGLKSSAVAATGAQNELRDWMN